MTSMCLAATGMLPTQGHSRSWPMTLMHFSCIHLTRYVKTRSQLVPASVGLVFHLQSTTWEGHSTLVDEVKEQLEEMGEQPPAAFITSVGGGGLAMGLWWCNFVNLTSCNLQPTFALGLVLGIERHGWAGSVPLVTMETEGADCFNQ